MNKNLQLHFRYLGADLFDLFQRQLAGQDHAGQAHLLPELHRRPVNRIRLHGEVNIHLREVLAHQHDQTRVGHNQRIRPHLNDRFQVTDKGFQLGVVRRNVDDHVEFFPLGVGFVDAELQVFVIEFIVTHAQRVAWLARIDGIGTIGESVTHILQRSRRGKEFWFKHVCSRSDDRSDAPHQSVRREEIPYFKGGHCSAVGQGGKPFNETPTAGQCRQRLIK
ncbi:hypothetical protein D3C75_543640 [compost metagenome]